MMNKVILSILIGFFIGVSVAYVIFTPETPVKSTTSTPKICAVLDKFEVNDEHYLEVALEVSAEEYIGYDIGDDYTLYAD